MRHGVVPYGAAAGRGGSVRSDGDAGWFGAEWGGAAQGGAGRGRVIGEALEGLVVTVRRRGGWLGGGDCLELLGEPRLAAGGGVGVDDAVAGGAVQRGLGIADEGGGVVRAIGDGEAGVTHGVGGAGANGLVAFGTGDVLSDALARG